MSRGQFSTEQMIALHGFFAEAAATGESAVVEVRCGDLQEFGERGLRACDDLVAAVMGRLEGGLPGSLGLALEPEDALAWARIGAGPDLLESFVALGRMLLEGVAAALSEVLRGTTSFQDAEPCLLAATHAPSDTLVVSARLRIDVRDEAVSAVAHLLVEPKYFARLLSALAAAIH